MKPSEIPRFVKETKFYLDILTLSNANTKKTNPELKNEIAKAIAFIDKHKA